MGKGPNWTQEEIEYLIDNYGLKKDAVITKHLNRTAVAVQLKASKLGLSKFSNLMTASDVAEIFGYSRTSHSAVNTWLIKGVLKGKKTDVGVYKTKAWHVTVSDLEKFIKTRTDLYDPRKIDRERFPYYANLVAKFLTKDFVAKNGSAWTEFEDAFLLNNRAKFTYFELAKRLHRTDQAVHGRLVLLKQKGRLLPYKKNWQTRKQNKNNFRVPNWTTEEENYLRQNWDSKTTARSIGEYLGRSEQAVYARASKLGLLKYNWNSKYQEGKGKEYVA